MHVYSDSLQLQVLTKCQVEFPVLYRRSPWVMYFVYSGLCLLIPTSCFIPSPASFPSGDGNLTLCACGSISVL